jgi:uncharacterized protein (TIGR01777 family)
MKLLITGATGFIGNKLIETLFLKGYEDINILSRDHKKAKGSIPFPIESFEWNFDKKTIDEDAFEGVDAIIHLAGENIADERWNSEKKEKILNSRVNSTQLLMETIKKLKYPPKKFITASAVGIYLDNGGKELNATSPIGDSFLSNVCKELENLTLNHNVKAMKSYILRIGIVLGLEGGALKKMMTPFKNGLAGIIGDGNQYMSWIHIDDLVEQFIFILENEMKHNIYNGVSPRPVSNYIFTKALSKELSRPAIIPIPKFALKVLFGEMSQILLDSQKVIPTRLMDEGFQWKFRSLKDALGNLLFFEKKDEFVLQKYQWINKPPYEVFDFFSDEKNLEKITPPFLNFKVLGKDTENIQEGTKINYKLKVHGITIKWISKIYHFEKNKQFIDEQIKGPYKKWIHTHSFYSLKKGTLIRDKVEYKVPFGSIGKLLVSRIIAKDLHNIFNYRKKVINKQFKGEL